MLDPNPGNIIPQVFNTEMHFVYFAVMAQSVRAHGSKCDIVAVVCPSAAA